MTTFVVALLAAVALVGAATAALPRLGVMDVPNHRSSHERPVPRGGGIPLVPCMALALGVSRSWTTGLVALVLGALALGVVGLIDDVRDVSATYRLAVQLTVSLAVAVGLVLALTDLSWVAGCAVAIGTAVWLTGVVNVYNFMDGANGVAGLQAAMAGGWFALVGGHEGVVTLSAGGLALLGVALGFLPWNFPRARVFLGDGGSYSVGVVLGALAVVTLFSTHSALLAGAPLLVFLTDAALTLARRAVRGEPVMTAHREHVYQRLTTTPGSPWPAVATSSTVAACLGLTAATRSLAWPVCAVGWCLVLAGYVALPSLLGRQVN